MSQPQRGLGEIEATPMTLREAVAAVLEDGTEWINSKPEQNVVILWRSSFDCLRAAYESDQPEPPVTPSLWRAARALIDIYQDRLGIPPDRTTVVFWRTEFEELVNALDATPEPVASLTDEERAEFGTVMFPQYRFMTDKELARANPHIDAVISAVLARLAGRA